MPTDRLHEAAAAPIRSTALFDRGGASLSAPNLNSGTSDTPKQNAGKSYFPSEMQCGIVIPRPAEPGIDDIEQERR
jgi:hypothetical protein